MSDDRIDDEDHIIALIDELYDAYDANEGEAAVARRIAKHVIAERDAELGRIVAYLKEQGAPFTADLLATKAHRS